MLRRLDIQRQMRERYNEEARKIQRKAIEIEEEERQALAHEVEAKEAEIDARCNIYQVVEELSPRHHHRRTGGAMGGATATTTSSGVAKGSSSRGSSSSSSRGDASSGTPGAVGGALAPHTPYRASTLRGSQAAAGAANAVAASVLETSWDPADDVSAMTSAIGGLSTTRTAGMGGGQSHSHYTSSSSHTSSYTATARTKTSKVIGLTAGGSGSDGAAAGPQSVTLDSSTVASLANHPNPSVRAAARRVQSIPQQ